MSTFFLLKTLGKYQYLEDIVVADSWAGVFVSIGLASRDTTSWATTKLMIQGAQCLFVGEGWVRGVTALRCGKLDFW